MEGKCFGLGDLKMSESAALHKVPVDGLSTDADRLGDFLDHQLRGVVGAEAAGPP